MLEYNKHNPLVFLHIPKTAGTSLRSLFIEWFGDENIIQCYNKENIKELQYRCLAEKKTNTVLYGHFSKQNKCIPEINQIITILREPFCRTVSEYFHRKRKKTLKPNIYTISDYFLKTKHSILTDRVSFPITCKNYKKVIDEKFLFVGITEYMEQSVESIAQLLDKPYTPNSIMHLNVASNYDEEIPSDLKDWFYFNYKLELDIYNYAIQKFKN